MNKTFPEMSAAIIACKVFLEESERIRNNTSPSKILTTEEIIKAINEMQLQVVDVPLVAGAKIVCSAMKGNFSAVKMIKILIKGYC